MNRHDCYEACVQSPRDTVALLRAVHGRGPRGLAEDFCGTAAVSRAWCAADPSAWAAAMDLDGATLCEARDRAEREIPESLGPGGSGRLTLERGDCLGASCRADVLFVGNFSIGEIHRRQDLLGYLRRARARLEPGGVFVCDTYGGESAFRIGHVRRTHRVGDLRIAYTWEQREADPLTGMVICALHFRADLAGDVVADLPDAFIYHWRLWSVPELRDAMREAGFTMTEVYGALPIEGRIEPIRDVAGLGESFIVCVVGRI
ncbi:MAG: class I SAM-dependent methyltransferase [Phycisphaeraceae bacterium]|nr:class I SAM-dependent methyltransferase [Phycisphaeraceae bacterium]